MALTLECFCPGDPNVAGCELVSMVWHIEIDNNPSPNGKSAIATATLATTGDSHTVSNVGGFSSNDITLDMSIWIPNWAAATITVGSDSSLLQIPIDDSGAPSRFHWYIALNFLCFDPDSGESKTETIYAIDTTQDTQTCVVGGVTRSITTAGGGTGLAVLLMSTTLGPCNGSNVTTTDFLPTPADGTVDGTTTGQWCLCPHGGTPPYQQFAILAGRLPTGQTLNPVTGCIEGSPTPTGSPAVLNGGTQVVTFGVFDSSGNNAKVTCNVVPDCNKTSTQNVGY